MRIAIVHDWLVTYGGAERVLEEMLKLYPETDLYSLYDFIPVGQRGFILDKKVTTSFLQKMPFARARYRDYLPLMPLAIEQFDLSAYDLIISSSAAISKGVITGPDQLHVCMCYSPARYAWDLTHQYLGESNFRRGPKAWLARYLLHRLRMWDVRTANGVDEFIAISEHIARRIRKVYRRESTVIYPPVDIEAFKLHAHKEDFYMTASRMVPYKKIDLIAEAFSKMPDKKLVIVGDGPDYKKVKRKAGLNVKLLGYQPFRTIRDLMQQARAFVFAAEEDFGIVAVEAQACGTPVIAYGKGGALETVVADMTGVFFGSQNTDSLVKAIGEFERIEKTFDPYEIRRNARRFSLYRFRSEFKNFIERALNNHFGGNLAAKSDFTEIKQRAARLQDSPV
jgi:glycosyltransferase involved in cell wall biosynthesis